MNLVLYILSYGVPKQILEKLRNCIPPTVKTVYLPKFRNEGEAVLFALKDFVTKNKSQKIAFILQGDNLPDSNVWSFCSKLSSEEGAVLGICDRLWYRLEGKGILDRAYFNFLMAIYQMQFNKQAFKTEFVVSDFQVNKECAKLILNYKTLKNWKIGTFYDLDLTHMVKELVKTRQIKLFHHDGVFYSMREDWKKRIRKRVITEEYRTKHYLGNTSTSADFAKKPIFFLRNIHYLIKRLGLLIIPLTLVLSYYLYVTFIRLIHTYISKYF